MKQKSNIQLKLRKLWKKKKSVQNKFYIIIINKVLTAEEYEQIRQSENLVLEEEKDQTDTFL